MRNSTCKEKALFSDRIRIVISLAAIVLLLSSVLPLGAQAAAGDLDTRFDADGRIITDFFGDDNSAHAVAIQSDGRIVAAGEAFNPGNSTYDFALTRYNADGSLDTSFGSSGRATADFLGGTDSARAIAIQSDGRIVVTGLVLNSDDTIRDFALARFNTDGSLDTSFGSSGKVTTDFFGDLDRARGITIQSDGRIVVAGETFNPGIGGTNFALARYNTDGSLDTSFDSDGRVDTDFLGGSDRAQAVAIQSDGRIIAAGTITGIGGDFGIVRYNTDGSLDTSFDLDGKVDTDFFASIDQAQALAIQSDGRIVVAGLVSNSSLRDFALARYNTDGSLDSSFDSDGKVNTDFFGDLDRVFAVAIQSDNRIVAAGVADPGTGIEDFALARYNLDGALDSSFGSAGRITTDFFGDSDQARGVAIQPDGRIVVAGFTCDPEGEVCDFALARYNTSPLDFCLQDDSNGNLLQFNSSTGDYLFTNCAGLTLGGKGALTKKGSVITLQHYTTDRKVLARVDRSSNRGNASFQLLPQGTAFGITDRNTNNNTCACR
ncbi:MAG: hypothetical protein AB1631_16865 [Acidobacteriota bacterium]